MFPTNKTMPENQAESDKFSFDDQSAASPGASGPGSRENEQTGETRELTSLLEMSNALSGALRVKTRIHQVLGILERHHGAFRSTVTLLREGTHELHIEASVG